MKPAFALFALAFFLDALPAGAEALKTLNVLFIGNSFTARHNLAHLVEAMAEEGHPGLDMEVTTVIYGGRTLQDHWRLGTANFVKITTLTAEGGRVGSDPSRPTKTIPEAEITEVQETLHRRSPTPPPAGLPGGGSRSLIDGKAPCPQRFWNLREINGIGPQLSGQRSSSDQPALGQHRVPKVSASERDWGSGLSNFANRFLRTRIGP
jgi:hypothetical protein